MNIEKHISPDSAAFLKREIEEACGREVLFIGSADENTAVSDIRVLARGNITSAPAIIKDVKSGDILIHNHPSGLLSPSEADINIASLIGGLGAGFFIVNNDVDRIYVVVPPFKEEKVELLDYEDIISRFMPDSEIPKALRGYEKRDEQLTMAAGIADGFNNNKIVLAEAGTGVGKSMAYLVPSIIWAVNNGERVVVSTNTINLQEQLIHKDIPFLQKNMKEEFKAALIKGRGNYVCKRKSRVLQAEGAYLFEDSNKIEEAALIDWIANTKDGSRSDLNFIPKEASWEKVASEADVCMRAKCFFYNDCFFYRARREAAAACILVANHHLLFADLAVKNEMGIDDGGVMPPYQRIILDEAHNIENIATEYFGGSISKRGIMQLLGRFVGRKDKKKGLLPYIYTKIIVKRNVFPDLFISSMEDIILRRVIPSIGTVSSQIVELFDFTAYLVLDIKEDDTAVHESGRKARITGYVENSPGWAEIKQKSKSLVNDIKGLHRYLQKMVKELSDMCDGDDYNDLQPSLISLKAYTKRLERFIDTLKTFYFQNMEGAVKWVDLTGSAKNSPVRLKISPLSVAEAMNRNVFDLYKTVILTSATLSVSGKFNFIKERIGLDMTEDKLSEILLESPFDYERQAFIGVPSDLPPPGSGKFSLEISKIIRESLLASDGRAFVLFTSYKLLNELYMKLKNDILLSDYNMMRQGDLPRHELVKRFRKDEKSIIFGTDSFWEGVDVSGDALMNVIITKLPFSPPDDPVVEARTELIEKEGGSAFMHYLLPGAVLKFRQGFGRLIRNKTDRGSILILDTRIIKKGYGRAFINSLPKCRVNKIPGPDLVCEMKAFFEGRETSAE